MSKRFREAVDRGLRSVKMSPDLEQKIYAETIDREGAVIMKKKFSMSLAAALIAILLLVGVAFATGIVQSIVSSMKGMYGGEDDSKYEALDELSSDLETTQPLSRISEYQLTLSQSYYDGEQIILGYRMDGQSPAADFSFGPGSERFDELESSTVYFEWEDMLTQSDYAQFNATLSEKGSVGIIFYDTYVGDHLLLADGTDLPAYNETKVDNGVYIQLLRPLPDAARNKPSLDIVFQVKRVKIYFYQDASGRYCLFDRDATIVERVAFTIPRSTEQVKWFDGTYTNDVYSSDATVQITPVNAWIKIQMEVPEDRNSASLSWDEIDQLKEKGIDIIRDYVLIADGTTYARLFQEDWIDATHYVLEGECAAAIGDCDELRLRPVYYMRGEVPEEDIILNLAE